MKDSGGSDNENSPIPTAHDLTVQIKLFSHKETAGTFNGRISDGTPLTYVVTVTPSRGKVTVNGNTFK